MIFYALTLLALVAAVIITAIAAMQDDLLALSCGLVAASVSAAVLHYGEAK